MDKNRLYNNGKHNTYVLLLMCYYYVERTFIYTIKNMEVVKKSGQAVYTSLFP